MYYNLVLLWNEMYFCSERWLSNQQMVNKFSEPEDKWLEYWCHVWINRAVGKTDMDYNIVLSEICSRFWALNHVSDALVSCRGFGVLFLSLTITTNSDWPEMGECLDPSQDISD